MYDYERAFVCLGEGSCSREASLLAVGGLLFSRVKCVCVSVCFTGRRGFVPHIPLIPAAVSPVCQNP